MRKHSIDLQNLGGETLSQDEFNVPLQNQQSVTPLLYQSGYETIKAYNKATGLYTIDVPNNEVRIGIANLMLQTLTNHKDGSLATATKMQMLIRQDRIDEAMQLLKTFMASLPYFDNARPDGHYQSMFYLIFTIMGVEIDVEVRTRAGRVDALLLTETHIYIFEMKVGRSPSSAIKQVLDRQYADRFALDSRPIVKVGVRFDSKKGVVRDWNEERLCLLQTHRRFEPKHHH